MADKVTMRALDTLHISNVSGENLTEGDVFIVSEAEAKHLESRGLAERGGAASRAVNAEPVASDRADTREEIEAEREKARPPHSNKMVAPPANKARISGKNKAS